MVNTRFWIDDYISNLDPVEKLLFLYFLTNPSTDISGVYEVPLKTIAVDTGIEKEMVLKILKRFKKDKKIFYEDGWVGIRNFAKHQNLNNPKIFAGIELGLNKAPKSLKDRLTDKSSEVMDNLSHLNSNSNSNPNSNAAEINSAEVISIIDSFKDANPSYKKWYANTTQRGACKRLAETHGLDRVLKAVGLLAKTNGQRYFPTITTPLKLEDRWADYESAFRRANKEEKNYVL